MKRRLFLEKVSLAAGFIAVPNIGWNKAIVTKEQVTNSIFHAGGNIRLDRSWSILNEGKLSPFTVVSGFGDSMNPPLDEYEVGQIDALLFERKVENTVIGYGKEGLPWVNSSSEVKPAFVKEYLITNRLGIKTGVLGIDLFDNVKNLDSAMNQINDLAYQLKEDMDCKQILCLVNDAKTISKDFSFDQIVRKSVGVDIFFGTCSEVPSNRLFALQNRNERQILLSLISEKASVNSNIEMENSLIRSYKVD